MKTEVLLRAFAQRTPDREAVVCDGRRITYAELECRTNRIANALGAHGVRAGDRVALLLANGIPWVELALGVIKCGALIVPISIRLTHQEIAFIVADSDARALLFDAERRGVAERAVAGTRTEPFAVAVVDALAERAGDGAPPVPPPLPDDCMIGYTSGTAGTPKGASVLHTKPDSSRGRNARKLHNE